MIHSIETWCSCCGCILLQPLSLPNTQVSAFSLSFGWLSVRGVGGMGVTFIGMMRELDSLFAAQEKSDNGAPTQQYTA